MNIIYIYIVNVIVFDYTVNMIYIYIYISVCVLLVFIVHFIHNLRLKSYVFHAQHQGFYINMVSCESEGYLPSIGGPIVGHPPIVPL